MTRMTIILNPAAGQEEPILTYINKAFKDTDFTWEVKVTQKQFDAKNFAQEARDSGVEIVAVYGGDGTLMEVAQALYKGYTKLAIIPGGTANVMAKELGIPIKTELALDLIAKRQFMLSEVDMGVCNEQPFLIRVITGSFADLVQDANPQLKEILGKIAYGVSSLNNLNDNPPSTYTMTLDGKSITKEGVALMVANSGHTGLPNLSFTDANSPYDGKLDILLITKFDIPAIAKMATAMLSDEKANDIVLHWTAKDVRITIDPACTIFCDDAALESTDLHIQVTPKAIQILTPLHDPTQTN